MSVREKQAEVVAEFSRFTDWEGRYKRLVELGRALPAIDDAKKTDAFRVKGCQSQVWIDARMDGDRIRFQADSDALLVRGLVALLLRVYDGQTPADVLATPPDFVREIGLETKLSPSRANGLVSMIKQMKFYAVAFASR